ncbi:MAG: N-acetyl-gamma-glutamyl-phosphate reductase [Nitrospirota bacterium]|nr:N-acetyl-gamma-glutamyl-phosphate reductase [Nitrospirota bacterium]
MKDQLRVTVIGASGYTGGELLRLLSLHPQAKITQIVASSKSEGLSISTLLPNLSKTIDVPLSTLDIPAIAKEADLVFLALPHTQSLAPVAELLSHKKLVVDLSADYRLKDAQVYEQWYQTTHPNPDILKDAVYGLPEFHRAAIAKSQLVAVPGCYPTVAILQLAPFVAQDLIEPQSIIIDAKSGVSGAGRTPSQGFHFPEANEAIHAYKIATHRHLPEIEQGLNYLRSSSGKIASASPITIMFTPHLIPINRGILSTAYAKIRSGMTSSDVKDIYHRFYQDEPFIRVCPQAEAVNPRNLRGANFCDLSSTFDPRTGLIISSGAIDNLVKGAAGQAIQCMNLMVGFPETMGLTSPGLFP